jgi:integrase
MAKAHLKLVVPTIEKRTVTPKRAKNSELRTREYLTEHEVEALMAAARKNRNGHRDATMILIAFRHGLRASELVDLRWDQVDFDRAVLHVRRAKGGTPSVHPLTGLEMRAVRRLQRESETSPFVFVSERGAPFTTAGFARMLQRAARATVLTLKVHPHMLRHACGFALANSGHDNRLDHIFDALALRVFHLLHIFRVGERRRRCLREGLSTLEAVFETPDSIFQ